MTRRLLALLSTLAVLAAGALAAASPATVVVLGDSYASGEGLATATDPCGVERDRSWGALLAAARDADVEIVACSGAEVADVTTGGPQGRSAQLSAVTGPAELAVLTLGGNDLGFVDIVADCLGFAAVDGGPNAPAAGPGGPSSGTWTSLVTEGTRDAGCDVSQDELLARVDGLAADDAFPLPDGSTGGLAEVYAATVASTLSPTGRLAVVGYPQLFAPVDTWAERYGRRCHGLRAEDAAELTRVVEALDALLVAEVAAANAALGEARVVHVPLVQAWAADGDHGLCGSAEPWVNGLTLVEGGVDVTALAGQLGAGGGLDLAELGVRPGGSFHPNTAGHVAIAGIVGSDLDAGA